MGEFGQFSLLVSVPVVLQGRRDVRPGEGRQQGIAIGQGVTLGVKTALGAIFRAFMRRVPDQFPPDHHTGRPGVSPSVSGPLPVSA